MRRIALLVVVAALVVTAMMVGAGPASARDNGITFNNGNGGNTSDFENAGGVILSGDNAFFFGNNDVNDDEDFNGLGFGRLGGDFDFGHNDGTGISIG